MDGERLVHDRVAGLQDLHGLQGAVAVGDAQGVVAVLVGAPSPAAALVGEVGEDLPGVGVVAADADQRRGAAVVGGDPLGQGVGQRPVDGHHQVRVDLGVAAHAGARVGHVHDRPVRGDDAHRPEAAVVRRDGVVGEVQQGVVRGRGGDAVGAVHRPQPLLPAAGVVHGHAVAVDGDPHLQQRLLLGHAVVVDDDVGEVVDAVGHLGDLGAHAALGVVLDGLAEHLEPLRTVAVHEFQHPPLPHVQRADHRLQVAVGHPRRAHVGHDDVPDGLHVLAALDDLQRRDAQPLLEDLGGVAGETAGHLAAHLGHVPDARHEGHQLVVVEDGLDDAVLGEVTATPERVVVEDHVLGVEVLGADLVDRPLDDEEDGAELRRAELGLRDHLAARVEDGAGEVQPLVEQRRVGRVAHGDAHLARRGDQEVVGHLQGDLVDLLDGRGGRLGEGRLGGGKRLCHVAGSFGVGSVGCGVRLVPAFAGTTVGWPAVRLGRSVLGCVRIPAFAGTTVGDQAGATWISRLP